jgi:hypothetical protein
MGTEVRTFTIECPQCHRDVRIRGEVHGRLTIEDGRPAALRLAVKAAPLQHRCKEPTLVTLPGMDAEQLEADAREQLEADRLEAPPAWELLGPGEDGEQLEAPG